MVLGDEDYVANAGRPQSTHPLFGIKFGWIEDLWVRRSVTPFTVHEGVGPKVDDGPHLQILPFQLLGRGFQVRKALATGEHEGDQRTHHERYRLVKQWKLDSERTHLDANLSGYLAVVAKSTTRVSRRFRAPGTERCSCPLRANR